MIDRDQLIRTAATIAAAIVGDPTRSMADAEAVRQSLDLAEMLILGAIERMPEGRTGRERTS